MPGKTPDPGSFGVFFLQISFFLFSIAIPLTFLIVLLILWIVPMKVHAQRSWFTFAEICNAWSAIEVFVLALIAAILEIR